MQISRIRLSDKTVTPLLSRATPSAVSEQFSELIGYPISKAGRRRWRRSSYPIWIRVTAQSSLTLGRRRAVSGPHPGSTIRQSIGSHARESRLGMFAFPGSIVLLGLLPRPSLDKAATRTPPRRAARIMPPVLPSGRDRALHRRGGP